MLPTSRAALALVLAAVLAGCAEDPFAPDLAPQGEARFTYTGDRTGEFAGSGRMNRRNPNAGAWAIGQLEEFEDQPILGIFGQQRRADLKIDGLLIEWEGAQVGTVTCADLTVVCPFTVIFVVGTQTFSDEVEAAYSNPQGSLTVTELTDDRARGTFSFTLRRQGATAEPPTIQATGSFDVPLNVQD